MANTPTPDTPIPTDEIIRRANAARYDGDSDLADLWLELLRLRALVEELMATKEER